MQYNETHRTLTKCFKEIESLTAIITNRLQGAGMPTEALFIEHWPYFNTNQILYKIWNGNKHIAPVNKKHVVPSMITADDILEIVKHREILYRKF